MFGMLANFSANFLFSSCILCWESSSSCWFVTSTLAVCSSVVSSSVGSEDVPAEALVTRTLLAYVPSLFFVIVSRSGEYTAGGRQMLGTCYYMRIITGQHD